MSQLSGAFSIEIDTTRLAAEIAAAVVAELHQAARAATTAGSDVYERDPGSPDPGAETRHRGAGFGGLGPDGTLTYENGDPA